MSESTFSYNGDKRFIRTVIASSIPKKLRQLNIVTAGLAALTGYAIVARNPWLALFAGVGAGFAAYLSLKAQGPLREVQKSLHAQFGSLPAPAEISVVVNDEGMRFTNAHGTQPLPWNTIESVHQTRRVWFVHTTDGATMPIPAAAIDPESAAAISTRATVTTA